MTYTVQLSRQVQKFLKKEEKKVLLQLKTVLEKLSQNPFDSSLDIKKLHGLENSYRLRIGKIRLLYTIFENNLIILFFKGGYRGDVYK